MGKATRAGASNAQGRVQRREVQGGVDVSLIGDSDVRVGGDLAVDGNLSVSGTVSGAGGLTAEVDSDQFTTTQTGIVIGTLTLVAIPLELVIPDLDDPCYVFAHGFGSHTVANAAVNAALAPVGSTGLTSAVITAPNLFGATGTNWGWRFQGRLPSHSPGTYRIFINGTAGTFTPVATDYVPSQAFAFRPLAA